MNYQKLNDNNEYEEVSEEPTEIGNYKVIITIDGISEELEFKIAKKVENPYTVDNSLKRYIVIIGYIILVFIQYITKK